MNTGRMIEDTGAVSISNVHAFEFMLCAWLAFTAAQGEYAEAGLLSAGEQPANEEEALSEISPISVESDRPAVSPTQEQLRRRFHDALGPALSAPEERRLADGTLQITTQLGHFCARPTPVQSQSGVGGNITLAAPCANF
jgi:hypothetical protein